MKHNSATTIIIILVVLGLGGFVYLSFFGGSAAPADQAGGEATSSASNAGAELVALLDQLKGLKMDNSIFSSPDFNSLVDETATVRDEPVGRSNPFAPIGSGGLFVAPQAPVSATSTQGGSVPSKLAH